MNNEKALKVLSVLLLFAAFVFFFVRYYDDSVRKIKERGKLTVIMVNNANVYYSYRDQYMGFEYDLAKAFADSLGVTLEVITPGWDELFKTLNSGKADLIAAGMTITEPREHIVNFSDGYLDIQQQVIVHKSNKSIQGLEDLAGKTIHIRSGTSYEQRLKELKDQGLDVTVVLHKNMPTEELINKVSQKKIEITIADSNIAMLNQRYYPDIRIAFPIEKTQSLGWAVRKGDIQLLLTVNRFLTKTHDNGLFATIYDRYYRGVSVFDYVDLKKFHRRLETRLPKYKTLIQEEAKKHGLDWRMIVAVVYQESHFNPRAKSYTGVRGLMQVTLKTAKEMGIKNRISPDQSIKAGVGYIAKLYDRFDDIENHDERILFALASYNVGYGHVRDAQGICRNKGWDPNRWASLKKALPLLVEEEYHTKTTYGYARGSEPVRFVSRILVYFDIIKQKWIKETRDPTIPPGSTAFSYL